MISFTSGRQFIIDSNSKRIDWLFVVTDSNNVRYYWSTKNIGLTSNQGDLTVGDSGDRITLDGGSRWDSGGNNQTFIVRTSYAFDFKVIDFNGIQLRRPSSETGIQAPSDVTFTISNKDNAIAADNLVNGTVWIHLSISNHIISSVIRRWRFRIRKAVPSYQEIKITAEDYYQEYLRGDWPNTKLVKDIFYSNDSDRDDNVCASVPFGTCYIPLRSVFITGSRYYLLGSTRGGQYTINKVRSPRQWGPKSEWDSGSYSFTQCTKTDGDGVNWRVFQAIIADSDANGIADANGLWRDGDCFLDMPTQFRRSALRNTTNPADVIEWILKDMGFSADDIDSGSFTIAKATYISWGLTFNIGFWHKESREKILASLLTMCHSTLQIGEKVELHVLSKFSQKTINKSDVIKPSNISKGSFRYRNTVTTNQLSDSGYVAYQESGEAQDALLKVLVPAKSSTAYISNSVLPVIAVQDSQDAQRIGTLHYQRKLLKKAQLNFNGKNKLIALQPDDVITIDHADYGGTYDVLIDSMKIKRNGSIDFSCIRFSAALDDWEDLSPAAITIVADTTSSANIWTPIMSGPFGGGASGPGNVKGKLRISSTNNYILIDPADPVIKMVEGDYERVLIGKLSVGNYGIRLKDQAGNTLMNIDSSSADIAGWTISQTTLANSTNIILDASNKKISIKSATFENDGIQLDYNSGNSRAYIGDGANKYFKFDGTNISWKGVNTELTTAGTFTATSANITGVITANTGKIGGADGWVISAGYLKDVAGVVGLSAVVTAGDDVRFWAGHATPESAPFRVTETGKLVATDATVSGTITASTIDIGGDDATSFHVDATGGIWSGSSIANKATAPFRVSNAGVLVATSANITGVINATSGKFGTATNYWSVGATGLTATSASSDVIINYGKTDFTNVDTGFILGYDFSASAAKFYIGDATKYLNWDGNSLTYTKGTLVETIIQMYTNVASLRTSATAGDGSAASAGMALTYEGLFGCGANQTSTIAAANANVRILADGTAYFKGDIDIGSMYALPSDEHLVGYWAFDDGSGTVAVDGSGNGNNGTLVNMEDADWVGGVVGKCLNFDGTDEWVTKSAFTVLSGDVTFSAWFKINTFVEWAGIVGNFWRNPYHGFNVSAQSSTVIKICAGNGDASYEHHNWAVPSLGSAWHYVSVVHVSGVFKVYLDGIYLGNDWTQAVDHSEANILVIGRWCATYDNYYFDGLIDEVRIYNTALTASEIKALYLYPAGNKSTRISGNQMTTGVIQSTNWVATAGAAGMQIDLDNATMTIREADGLQIDSASGIKVLSGGDITLVGNDSNPGLLIMSGVQDIKMGSNHTWFTSGIWPDVTNSGYFCIGYNAATQAEQRFSGINLSAVVSVEENAYFGSGCGYAKSLIETSSTAGVNTLYTRFAGLNANRTEIIVTSESGISTVSMHTAHVERLKIDINGLVTLTNNLLVNGGDIGITADTDLIQLAANALTVNGTIDINTIAAGTSDYDKFLVSDSGVVKYRTGAQVLSDIGAMRMKTGSYTGDGNDNRSINIGININAMSYKWLVIKAEFPARKAVHKFGHETGDISDFFTETAQHTNYIQAWTPTGFQVGSADEVNFYSIVYNYVVFYQP